jgi:hypothetical protein
MIGARVEVRRHGQFIRAGRVEDATPSGDTVWIAADGIDRRAMFEKSGGYTVWIAPTHLQPKV